MTRAIIKILHFDFKAAYDLNHRVIILFPLLAFIWLKTTIKKFEDIKFEIVFYFIQ